MTARDQGTRLITRSDVNGVLDRGTVASLAKEARLPLTADLVRFRDFLRVAIHGYLEDINLANPADVRKEIARLNRSARAALKGDWGIGIVKRRLLNLSPEAREYLYSPSHPIPNVTDLDDPARRDWALRRLAGLTARGAEWKPGRKRSGGKRSRDTLTRVLKGPPAVRGRPPNRAGRMLCVTLAAAYEQLSGRPLPRSVHHRQPGPFLRLVNGVLNLIGASDVDAEWLVNRFLSQKYSG